jgi:tetratricopeptide (TPR) repeat protein
MMAGAAAVAALAIVALIGRGRTPFVVQPAPPAPRAAANTPTSTPPPQIASPSRESDRSPGGAVNARFAGNLKFQDGNHAGALEDYQAALQRNPNDLVALNGAAQSLVHLRRSQEALPYLDRLIDARPDEWQYRFNRGFAYGTLERWRDAIEDYKAAATAFRDDYSTAFNLAQAYHKMGDDRSAVDEYQRAISLKADDPTFYLALATSYEKLRKSEDAVLVYRKYLELWPNAADAARVKGRLATVVSGSEEAAAAPTDK